MRMRIGGNPTATCMAARRLVLLLRESDDPPGPLSRTGQTGHGQPKRALASSEIIHTLLNQPTGSCYRARLGPFASQSDWRIRRRARAQGKVGTWSGPSVTLHREPLARPVDYNVSGEPVLNEDIKN